MMVLQHEKVSIAFLVALEEGANLAKAKIDDLDKKSVVEATQELKVLADKLRRGEDAAGDEPLARVVLEKGLEVMDFKQTSRKRTSCRVRRRG